MYHLLAFYTQNSMKVLYVLEALEADYELEFINLFKGEHKQDRIRRLNPFTKLPILEHEGHALFESGAICRYLATNESSPLYPDELWTKAKVDQWMDFFSCHLGRWLNTLFFEKHIKAAAGLGEINQDTWNEAVGFANQQLRIVDHWLAGNKYSAGEFSIADLFAFAYVEQYRAIDLSIDAFSNVRAWLETIESNDFIRRAREKVAPFK